MNPTAGENRVISINSNCGNITDSYKNVYNECNISVSDERRHVLEWLSPVASREKHKAVRDTQVDGVGQWLLRTENFSSWRALEGRGAKPVLLCYGDPGVGKTYMSSLVIDTLSRESGGDGVAVPYVYCDFSTPNVQSASAVFGSLLRQVVGALEQIPDDVRKAFEREKRQVDGCGLRFPEIVEMLIKYLSSLKWSFICIDALDEFPPKCRPKLWESLRRIIRECPNARLFVTGRPHIRDEVGKYFPGDAQMLPISPSKDDIGLYLEMRLKGDPEPDVMDGGLRADILRVIPERIAGIFLLVCICMDAVLDEPTIHRRRQVLHKMTNGLGLQGAYSTTLDRIRQQGGSKSRLGNEALMWISRCKRPLKSGELCNALGVELGAEDINIANVPLIKTVLGCTLGLVRIDENTSTLYLLHHTLQEYLEQPTLFVTADSMMAEVCLTYLNSRSIRALPPLPVTVLDRRYASYDKYPWETHPQREVTEFNALLAKTPFIEYATCFWGTHAAKEVTGPVNSLALRLLGGYESHISAAILWRKKILGPYSSEDVAGISGLHCISFWGVVGIAISMLERERWDVNGRDSRGHTPLMWAVKHEQVELVKLLLEQEDIEPNVADKGGRTALSNAARGNGDMAGLLLQRKDVNPDSSDDQGLTPLSYAVLCGSESAVGLLLQREDVNPNSGDKDGRTPLLRTVCGPDEPREDIVKLLLERRDIDPNLPDREGRTALSHAAEWGDLGVVKSLLERGDVDPNLADKNGETPLSYSLNRDINETATDLLLGHPDINPDPLDNKGRTFLSHAVKWGWEDVVELLLQREDVNPNLADSGGRTPLSYALDHWRVYEGILKQLLGHPAINPDSPDNKGRTPLSYAAGRGHEDAVKLLLQRGDVNPNSVDKSGDKPLSHAVRNRHLPVLKLLSEYGKSSWVGGRPIASVRRRNIPRQAASATLTILEDVASFTAKYALLSISFPNPASPMPPQESPLPPKQS